MGSYYQTKEYSLQLQKTRMNKNKCRYCGRTDERTLSGKSTCERCLINRRKYYIKKSGVRSSEIANHCKHKKECQYALYFDGGFKCGFMLKTGRKRDVPLNKCEKWKEVLI